MRRLNILELDFSHCPGVRSIAGLVEGFQKDLRLKMLQLNLEGTFIAKEEALNLHQVLQDNRFQFVSLDIKLPSAATWEAGCDGYA